MNLPKTLRRWLSITVLMMASLFLAAACQMESTPTPTPTPDLGDLLSNAGEKLAAMSTAKFKMVDEMESGAKFFGTTSQEHGRRNKGSRQLQDAGGRGGSGFWICGD